MIVWRCRRNALQRLRCGGAAVLRSGGARARAATPTQKRWETGKQAYQVGDLVEVRDGSEAWRLGVVTGYKKGEVMVMVDGWRNACSWDQVQAIPYQPAPDWLEEGDRILCDGQKMTVERIRNNRIVAVGDAWRDRSKVVQTPVEPLRESGMAELVSLVFSPRLCLHVVKTEGFAVLGIYVALRVLILGSVMYFGFLFAGIGLSDVTVAIFAETIGGMTLLGHIIRPFLLYLALLVARKSRFTRRLRKRASHA